jgi:hypothetical protein
MSRPQIRVLQFERAGLIGFRRATFSASSAESCQQRSRLMQGLGHSSLAALDFGAKRNEVKRSGFEHPFRARRDP